jgi:hypothetical protein
LGNTHLNKTVDAKTPMHRITGSIAYGNLPRNVHFVVRDPDDPKRRFFKQAKCNNADDDLAALAFRIEPRQIEGEKGEMIETAVPVFEPEPVSVDLHEAVNGGRERGKRGPKPVKTLKFAEWLHDFLNAEQRAPRQLAKVISAAGEAGLMGERKADGKWSGVGSLYDARDLVPMLPEPRHGMRVDEELIRTMPSGRELKHWYLIESEVPF